MTKRFLPLMIILALFGLTACADAPIKYSSKKIPLCTNPGVRKAGGVPYQLQASDTCVVAIRPFDVSGWIEAPLNSHRVRGVKTVQLGCKPLSVPADNCDTCGLPGHSNTLMMKFDVSVCSDAIATQKVTLAV